MSTDREPSPRAVEAWREMLVRLNQQADWYITVMKMGEVGLFGEVEFELDPTTEGLMAVWDANDTGHFSGDRHHGQPGDPGYNGQVHAA